MNESLHQSARLPADEALRLEALRSYAILDTAVEAAFDDVARLASQICETPIALVSLVDADRQWFKAEVGLGTRETPRRVSACAHAILEPGVFVVPDTLLDPRFAHSPLVHGNPEMRFYAGAPLRTADGFPLGTVCVLDRKPRQLGDRQLEALLSLSRQAMALMTLHRALHDADAMQQHLRRIMTVAGHDLRQPLQIISLSLELAQRRSSDPLALKQLGLGQVATQKLGQALDDLAKASIPAAKVVVPERITVPVTAIFETMRNSWRPMADLKGLQLRFAPSSLKVLTNPKLINTILGNLIGNAIKYTDHGKVLVGCRRLQRSISIEVLDTGIGIAPERQTEMFGAFRKADPRSAGLGLGLSIARNTADLLGHELHLRSIPGRGTEIRLSVPRAE